jgi:hypothetical protein
MIYFRKLSSKRQNFILFFLDYCFLCETLFRFTFKCITYLSFQISESIELQIIFYFERRFSRKHFSLKKKFDYFASNGVLFKAQYEIKSFVKKKSTEAPGMRS